jgi:hypothetical protein
MRRLHKVASNELRKGFPSIAYAYVWNDSVLLLSYVEQQKDGSFERAMRDADKLKRKIDTVGKSYAIAIKGRAFPVVSNMFGFKYGPRVEVLRTSSWAMANCFEVQRKLRDLKAEWYVDERISQKVQIGRHHCGKRSISMFPSGEERSVFAFGGYLWN